MTTPTDPRIRQLAEARQQIGHQGYGSTANWNNLKPDEQQLFLTEAAAWLRAAIAAGIAPAAERPTDEHDAVYIDDEGYLYAEYRTDPESDSIVRLVWAREQAESKRALEEHGAEFRLIGWST
jgi:hypothetical protein